MLQPLDVWLGITVHLAVELYITSYSGCLVFWQPSMQNGPMWEALCKTQTCQVQWVQWPEADLL